MSAWHFRGLADIFEPFGVLEIECAVFLSSGQARRFVTVPTEHVLASVQGDAKATRTLTSDVYDTLRRIARAYLRDERHGHTLSATALVHEAYLRLVDQTQTSPEILSHFVGIAARVMRQVLVDYARRRGTAKRGAGAKLISLDEPFAMEVPAVSERLDLLLSVDRALALLGLHDERLERVVECRYFAGLSEEETARTLRLSTRTVQRDWRRARAYLSVILNESSP